MSHSSEANLRVKRSITDALFALMRDKPLPEIQITEIIRLAGVARASFYRNYASREDVIITLIRDTLDAFYGKITFSGGFYTYENVLLSFQFLETNRHYVLGLYRAGLVTLLLEELNHFHEGIEGTMPSRSINKYALYMYIGALFNTALVWLQEDNPVSAEEISHFFLDAMSRMLNR